jgi:hypothetical protein
VRTCKVCAGCARNKEMRGRLLLFLLRLLQFLPPVHLIFFLLLLSSFSRATRAVSSSCFCASAASSRASCSSHLAPSSSPVAPAPYHPVVPQAPPSPSIAQSERQHNAGVFSTKIRPRGGTGATPNYGTRFTRSMAKWEVATPGRHRHGRRVGWGGGRIQPNQRQNALPKNNAGVF